MAEEWAQGNYRILHFFERNDSLTRLQQSSFFKKGKKCFDLTLRLPDTPKRLSIGLRHCFTRIKPEPAAAVHSLFI